MDKSFAYEDATMRAITAHLRRISELPSPPPAPELTEARWQLLWAILRQFILKGRLIHGRLARHPDPEIARRAREFAAESEALYDMFVGRSEGWTPEGAEADWPAFRASLRQLTDLVDARLAREAAELLPHLKDAPPADDTSVPDRDWAVEEERLRTRLGKWPPGRRGG
jgi:hypothetical protein